MKKQKTVSEEEVAMPKLRTANTLLSKNSSKKVKDKHSRDKSISHENSIPITSMTATNIENESEDSVDQR